jgi:hypothetical protein
VGLSNRSSHSFQIDWVDVLQVVWCQGHDGYNATAMPKQNPTRR